MDIKTNPQPCRTCGKVGETATGCCSDCHLRAAVAYNAYLDGDLSKHEFYLALQPAQSLADGPVFPVAGDTVTCGKRTDVSRQCRRHLRASLGMDTRNLGDRGFWDVEVFACVRCGRDSKGSSKDANAISRME